MYHVDLSASEHTENGKNMIDRNNPSFVTFEYNNDRTGYKPYGLPIILVVPYYRNNLGGVRDVTISIVNAPKQSIVAGHDHVGLIYPNRELYQKTLSSVDLAERLIPNTQFVDDNGTELNTGDISTYRTTSGTIGGLEYIEQACYYDLSDILIETDNLKDGKYTLVYSCSHNRRIIGEPGTASEGQLFCISSDIVKTQSQFTLNHPGDLMAEFYRLIPEQYFTNSNKSTDTTLEFIRPFTDILQNIYDEQQFLESINWVSSIPYDGIQYLSQILGWDMPYFPNSIDQLRRAVLQSTRRLQLLRGSRRGLIELMDLFGFNCAINHVWWSEDEKSLLSPSTKIHRTDRPHYEKSYFVDPILNNYQTNGYCNLSIPLSKRPQVFDNDLEMPTDDQHVTVWLYVVRTNSDASKKLDNLVEKSIATGLSESQFTELNSSIVPKELADTVNGMEAITATEIVLNGKDTIDQASVGEQIIYLQENGIDSGIQYDRVTNTLSIIFNKYVNFTDTNSTAYVFAAYKTVNTYVPVNLSDFRSNRFEIKLTNKLNGKAVSQDVLEFVIEFVYRIKAFHSLLHLIRYTNQVDDTYVVTDLCVGGDVVERHDTAIGQQQVPPAITPTTSESGCESLSPKSIGYKDSDLSYRRDIYFGAIDELNTDNSGQEVTTGEINHTSKFTIEPQPDANGRTNYLQLNKINSSDSDASVSQKFKVESDTQTGKPEKGADYCFKGRVSDEAAVSDQGVNNEQIEIDGYGFGNGVYWSYPHPSKRFIHATVNPSRSRTRKSLHTALTKSDNEDVFENTNINKAPKDRLGLLIRAYGTKQKETLHYSNNDHIEVGQLNNLAIERPKLNILKKSMGMPGHRLPSMGSLANDYTSSIEARPWDPKYNIEMVKCGSKPNWLGATLTNNKLDFDYELYSIDGNGEIQDFVDMGGVLNGLTATHSIAIEFESRAYDSFEAVDNDTTSSNTITDEYGNEFYGSIGSNGAVQYIIGDTRPWLLTSNSTINVDCLMVSEIPDGSYGTQMLDFVERDTTSIQSMLVFDEFRSMSSVAMDTTIGSMCLVM